MKTERIKRVNIVLTQETLNRIDRAVPHGSRSRFIDCAVNFYMKETGRKHIREALKEGALKRAEHNRDISAEWFNLDEEVWQENAR